MRQLAGVLLFVCFSLLSSVSLVESFRGHSIPSFCRQFIDQTQSANSTEDDIDDEDEEEEFGAKTDDVDSISSEFSENGDDDDDEDEDEDVMQIAVEEIEMLNMLIEFMGYVGYSSNYAHLYYLFDGGSVAEWLACWTQVQKGRGSYRSRDAVG